MAKRSGTITGAVLRNLLAALAAGGVAAIVVILLTDIMKDSSRVSSAPLPPPSSNQATAVTTPGVTAPTMAPGRNFKLPGFRMPRRPKPFEVVSQNTNPVRIAEGPRGWIYVTDSKAGSVFIYDQNLELKRQLKGIRRPLGIAVDDWHVMVGNDSKDCVEFYNKVTGKKQFVMGLGEIKMPTDMVLDGRGKLYVVDSRSNAVKVYSLGLQRKWIRDIGEPGSGPGQLSFPVSVAVVRRRKSWRVVEEVFVADQGNKRVQVFDTKGNFLRYYEGFEPEVAGFSMAGPNLSSMRLGMFGFFGNNDPFQKLQSLAVDRAGRVHTLDNFRNRVLVIDSANGDVLGEYGEYGSGPGQLDVPQDILITKRGRILVTNMLNERIEEFPGL